MLYGYFSNSHNLLKIMNKFMKWSIELHKENFKDYNIFFILL